MFKKEITFDRFIRGLIILVVITLLIYLLNILSNVLLPFFIAWLFAYMIYPLVKFFQEKARLRYRVLSIIVTLVVILAVISAFLLLVIPPVISEFVRFRTFLTDFIIQTGNSGLAQHIEGLLHEYIDQNSIVALLQENNIMEALKVGINQMWSIVSQTMDIVIGLFGLCIILLYIFFILLDYEKLSNGWYKLIPKPNRRFVIALTTDVKNGMNAYFRGQALVAFIVGVLFSIGFVIIDFPMAVGLGIFIGFLNLVPYLQTIGFIPTILLALVKANETGESFWWIFLCACLVFAVVQTIQDMILVPKIMGKLMGLNPAVILLSLSIWGSLLGIIGLIIALPLTTLLLSYYKRFIERDERKNELLAIRKQRNFAFYGQKTPAVSDGKSKNKAVATEKSNK